MTNSPGENHIVDSIKEVAKDRLGNHLYGTFVIAWCISNWEALYATFFMSEELILNIFKEAKLEYIKGLYPLSFQLWPLSTLDVSLLTSIGKLILFPAFGIYLVFWIFSEIDETVSSKSHDNELRKRIRKEQLTEKFFGTQKITYEKQAKALEEVLEAKEQKTEVEKQVKSKLSDEEKWELELNESISSNSGQDLLDALAELSTCLYKFEGRIDGDLFKFSSDNYAILDVYGLIRRKEETFYAEIEPTEKGRYYLMKYISKAI